LAASKPISQFSEQELRDYACEHVRYEIVQFVRSVEKIAAAERGRFPMNFALEVFAIHLRNLLDFFYPPPNARKTDVSAPHSFSDSSRWRPPPKSDLLQRSHDRAHKEIAHLTTDRKTDPAQKQWDAGAIYAEMKPIIEQFLREADLRLRQPPGGRDEGAAMRRGLFVVSVVAAPAESPRP
jgi:hypothetical protein